MADPSQTDNTTDTTTLQRRPRRSSILKPTRPPLEDVDQNITRELGETRRLSKRVSFSDTHEIKLFKCEVSEELGSSADNIPAESDLATRVKTDDLLGSSADALVVQSHEQHDALEQSFYCSEDGAGNSKAVCFSERTSVLMEDALSCLVFNGASSGGTAGKRVSSACPNKTTLASETMNLTCANASSMRDQLAVERNAASACHEKTMDMTCANTSSVLGQIPTKCVDGNASTIGPNTMDLTCPAASFVLDQMTTDRASVADRTSTSSHLNKTVHFREDMNVTCEVSSTTEQIPGNSTGAHRTSTSDGLNKTMHFREDMNVTCEVSSATEQMPANSMGAHRTSTSGHLNMTMLFQESMDVTCKVSPAAEQMPAHSTAAHREAPSDGDVVVYLHETMNATCASGAMDSVTDASTSETEPDPVGHVYQTGSDAAAVKSVGVVPKVTTAEGSCSVPKPAQRFDLGFVTLMRKSSASDVLGDDEGPARTACDSATVGLDAAAVKSVGAVPKVTAAEGSCSVPKPAQRFDLGFVTLMRKSSASDILGDDESSAKTARDSATVGDATGIAGPVVPFNLCSLVASLRKNNANDILEDDGIDEHCVLGASVRAPGDATCSSECHTSAEATEAREISNMTLLPAVNVSSATDHLPVTMNITGLDISGRHAQSSGTLSSGLDLPSTKGSGSCMSLTCAFTGGLNDDSVTPVPPRLAGVTSSGANHEQSNGSTSHDGKMQGEAAGNGSSFNPGKTCLLTVAMDVTCVSTAAPVVIEQETVRMDSKDSGPIIKACKHSGKGVSSEEAAGSDKLKNLDGADHQCSRADGNDLDGSRESARDCTAGAAGLPNMSAGLLSAMTPCKILLEPTLTSAPVLVPGSLLDSVAPVEPAACNTSLSDAAPQESPLPVEAIQPSFYEATPEHKATVGTQCVKDGTVITPVQPASSKSSEGKAVSALKKQKQLAEEARSEGYCTLTGKDSIALQLMVSPTFRASRSAHVASSSKSKSVNAASVADMSAVHRKFNGFLDSTLDGNISGLDVSALLATTIGDVDSILGDASLPHIAQGKPSAHRDRGDMLKSSSKGRRQPPNGTSHSLLAKGPGPDSISGDALLPQIAQEKLCMRDDGGGMLERSGKGRRQEPNGTSRSRPLKCSGEDSSINSCSGANVGKTVPQAPSVGGEVLARQKNTTFVVPSKNSRPSSTFAVLSPPGFEVVCIDGSTADENAAGKSELPPAPADAPCASAAAPRSSSAKRLIAGAHQPSVKDTCDQSAATSKFRKRLEFAGLHEQPRGVQTGTASDGLGLDVAFDSHPVSSSKVPSESSGQLPVSGSARPSCPERNKVPYCGSSCAGSDECSWLMDVPEPSLVTNSPTAPSMQAAHQDDGTALTSPEGREKAVLVDGHIPTSFFYSSSTAKKRSKPASTLSSRSSESGRSKTKKQRVAKAGAKSSDRKGRRTPASSSRKRRASQGTLTPDTCKEKAKRDRSGVRGAGNEFTRVADRKNVVVAEKRDYSPPCLFSCDLKLHSLPPTPPGLLENILDTGSPEQTSQELAAIQSNERAEAQAPPEPPDICEPVVFDTAEVDLTAGINIDDIVDRLDDANVVESFYWSFTEIPQESLKEWELCAIEMEPHKAVFGFIKNTVKVIVSLGDFVRQSGSTDKGALAKRTAGTVPQRSKWISALSFQINCLPQAHFNQYMLKKHLPETFKTDELLKRYPTTESLGKMLEELGNFVVRHRPLCQDVASATVYRPYSFDYPVLSIHIVAPMRLIWFHLDLPIDLDTYPHGEILPSSRPYSEEYGDIKTEKLRRITAHVKPGPKYLTRIVEEIEAFIEQ